MPGLDSYPEAILATSRAIQDLFATARPDVQVTVRTADDARLGVQTPSLNIFLYRDVLIGYRDGAEAGQRALSTELHYLISAHAGDAADSDGHGQLAYGSARVAVERHPVLTVQVGGESVPVRLAVESFDLGELTALWQASGVPLRFSFGLTAAFALDRDRAPGRGLTVHALAARATAGFIAGFSGTDAAGIAAGAASVAADLGRRLVTVPLGDLVNRYIGETEKNLERLFNRAEEKDWVLLLDEADALFGARTAVREAHNRYADVDADAVLDLLAAAPVAVIVGVSGEAGEALVKRAGVLVPFPPGLE